MRLPSLVAQACDPVLNTKDGGIKVVWKMVSGLALTPMRPGKAYGVLRCLIRAAWHIHISLHSPLV